VSLSVDIEVRRGEFTLAAAFEAGARALALFGRSGAGKSTLSDAIAGLTKPKRGRIVLDGQTLFDSAARVNVPAWRRRIGYVFQAPRLFPHLSVRQNLLYGAPDAAGLDETADLLGLAALLDRRPGALSGGEARRVAIGRALLTRPQLLILDEPLAGLDGARKAELLPYLDSLKRAGGVPLIYVSHAVDEVTRLADEMVLIAGGRTLICGKPADVFDHPEAEAAAALDAPISILDGVAVDPEADGAPRVRFGEHRFLAPRLTAAPGEPVRLVVDARDVAIALTDPKDLSIQNRLPMRVASLTPRADGVVARLEAPGVALKSLITPAAVQQLGLVPGREVIALVKATAAARHG
jgi:molybdate transport system ATP-binding protein